ncbi:MAG TPA: amino acid ABC transporter permease [Clostridiaceae bacterium]|nr:amino acid ABC transporter permease [Clostridiaceae bacterium]
MIIQIGASIVIDFSRMVKWIPTFMEGVGVTIVLSLVTVALGSILGLVVTLIRRSRFTALSMLAKFYTLFIRGTPLLAQLYIWLYGLPIIGIVIPPLPINSSVFGTREFSTAVIALGINSSAYVAEILRGGLDAIDKGQSEAARSLGLSSRQTMQHIVIPQAIRVILPGLGNEFIQMIKESSIVSTVGIFDVMYTSNIVKAGNYLVFEPLIVIALIYLILTSVLTFLQRQLERKLNVDLKNS